MMYPVTIGHSEVKVNPLGLGTNAVGGYNLFPGLDDFQRVKKLLIMIRILLLSRSMTV